MLSKTYTKYIQGLHNKKHRDKHGSFIAEGSKVVMDLLKSQKIVCETLLGDASWLKDNEPQIRKYFAGELHTIEDYELEKISALNTPNHVLGVFKKLKPVPIQVRNKIILALDTIQDPGNLGTIIRIADWFGLSAIVCSETCADLYNPKVVQSTMGSMGRVDVLYQDLTEWLEKNKETPVYAASLEGKNIDELREVNEAIIIIGNESKGISDEVMQMAHERITIPKIGGAESLNAAVAAGIILSHITTRRL
jgi:RNA methyltransferase, TrmH family